MILGMVIVVFSLASDPVACKSLSTLSCAPGRYSDGTGIVASEREISKAQQKITEATEQFFEKKISELLNNKDNEYFRETAKNALGLAANPQCQSSNPVDKGWCDTNLREGLVGVAMDNTGADNRRRLGSLESVDRLVQNAQFQEIINEANKLAEESTENSSIGKRLVNETIPKVKNLLISRINDSHLSQEQKSLITSKIKSIRFAGMQCKYGKSLSTLFTPNANYHPPSNTFRFCNGMASQVTSEFSVAMIVAHELAHSIDPCSLSAGLGHKASLGKSQVSSLDAEIREVDEQSPFANLLACLRSKESISAVNLGGDTNNGVFVDPATLPKSLCNDQITESFADWMGAEILSDYIRSGYRLKTDQFISGYANTFRALCSSATNYAARVHPDMKQRIDRILLANPKVRADMGCKDPLEGVTYCKITGNEIVKKDDAPAEGGQNAK